MEVGGGLQVGRHQLPEETVIELTRVSDKGQIVIPKEIRDKFNFTEGTKLIVLATGDAVVLQKVEAFVGTSQAKGIVGKVARRGGRLHPGQL